MSSPPSSKRLKQTSSSISPARPPGQLQQSLQAAAHPAPNEGDLGAMSPPAVPPSGNRKRRRDSNNMLATPPPIAEPNKITDGSPPGAGTTSTSKKGRPGRTNTPWSAEEEQRLKVMRDAGNSWSEIAKQFPNRTEGSVKKHWYKDMHYAEFAEDESNALREAIKEYDANKWKVIGQKVGKPAKACEQYAREHFK